MKTRIFTLFILAAFTLSGFAAVTERAVKADGSKFQKTPVMKAPRAESSADVYYESFDNGVGTWVITDAAPEVAFAMNFGALTDLTAVSGTQYLISGYDETAARDAWAISPGVSLLPGTYYVSAYIYTPGWEGVLDSLVFTMGTDNTIAAQTTVLLSTNQETEGWTLVSAEFTVASEALYNFGIHHATEEIGVNAIGVEDFRISTEEPLPSKPVFNKVDFFGGVWNYDSSNTLNLFSDTDSVLAMADVLFAETYLWSANNGLVIDPATEFYAQFGFPTPGDYTVSLTATNTVGDATGTFPLTVNFPADEQPGALWINKSPYEELEGGFTFTSGEDIFGLNSSYSSLIERYSLPEGVYAGVDSVILSVEKFFLQEENATKTVTIRLLGVDADGYPNDNWEFGRFEGTFASIFGELIEDPTEVVVKFPATVGVKGQFFVAVDMATPGDTIDVSEGRDYLAFNFVYRGSSDYATATAYIDDEDYGWVGFHEAYGRYVSLGFIPSVKMGKVAGTVEEETAIKNTNADNKLSVYPNPAKEVLYISNLADNSSISIADITGKQVAAYRANTVQNGVSISGLSTGLYIITVRDAEGVHTTKFVKE